MFGKRFWLLGGVGEDRSSPVAALEECAGKLPQIELVIMVIGIDGDTP
jgi:hypothetical protein